MQKPAIDGRSNGQLLELLRSTLSELAVRLDISVEAGRLQQSLSDSLSDLQEQTEDSITLVMMRAAQGIGIRVAPIELGGTDAWELVLEGFVVIAMRSRVDGDRAILYSDISFGKIDATIIQASGNASESLTRQQLIRQMKRENAFCFVAEPSLTCASAASSHQEHISHSDANRVAGNHGHDHDHDDHAHEHLSPLRRMIEFLKVDTRDIWSLVIFGFVVAVLELSTPLAIEQMVTTIGFTSLTQPLIWLAVLLFALLSLSAVIKALQFFIVEILQRRMFVRIVGDLSERLPRLERSSMRGIYGPEMANRFFDVMTMQKATATLLVEGLSLIIQTLTGLLLLAIYSPFLLAFDIVLIMCMTLFLLILGRNAVRTAIEESLVKYRIAHWLQDVIGNPLAFQVHGGRELVVDRANRLTVEYLAARRKHFLVLMRQTLFSLLLYSFSITAILALGLWLVLSNTLTIGQLVASVSVIAIVVGAFAKIGKSLESFYDLMASTDKVGHLIDLPTLPPSRTLDAGNGPVEIRMEDLGVQSSGHKLMKLGNIKIPSGARYAIYGDGDCGRPQLMECLCGLDTPAHGLIEIGGVDSREVNRFSEGSMVAIASKTEIFHGTLQENISLNRLTVSSTDVREALITAGLWDEVLTLPNGLETSLQSDGYPLEPSQMARLMIARAIVSTPRLLLIDGVLDALPGRMRNEIWDRLRDKKQPWTLIVATHDPTIIEQCDGNKDLSSCEHG